MLPESLNSNFLRQLELLRIRARRAFLGTRQGGHISPKRGHGIEFSDYRQYELGDDPRHIDWGVFGRSDRLYVKQFQEEQELSMLVMIDPSASMLIPAEDQKWERARDLALALSYIALLQQDSVLLSIPGISTSQSQSGGRAIHTLGRILAPRPTPKDIDLLAGIQSSLSRVRFPGVAILISDFLMPFETVQKIAHMVQAKNLDTHAIQVLGQADVNPLAQQDSARVVDSETGEEVELTLNPQARKEYAALLAEHNERVQQLLASSGISYSVFSPDLSLSEFIIGNLTHSGLFGR